MKNILALTAISIALAGCATSELNYSYPQTYQIKNQEMINESFDVVWDRLVKNLSSDFFVINNIEKNSRIINVSFSENKPSKYVDCGTTTREFSNIRGKTSYTYDPADSARYTFTNGQGQAFNATRTSRLNGRTNIYLAPEGNGTLININTKYVVDVDIKYQDMTNKYVGNDNFVFDFSTKTNFSNLDGVTCTARGNLEERILNYAK